MSTASDSAVSQAGTISDAAVGDITKKIEGMGMVRRTTSTPGFVRRSSADMGLSPEQQAIIDRMRAAQDSCGGFLDSSKKTMEATSSVLWDHFKKIPQEKLQSHIILRFNSYDTDHSGSLDRPEMREAMAEMGRRPTEAELDELMKIADHDGDGTINLEEFSLYIFERIGVKDSKKSKELRKAEQVKKMFGRSPSAPGDFERLKSSESTEGVTRTASSGNSKDAPPTRTASTGK